MNNDAIGEVKNLGRETVDLWEANLYLSCFGFQVYRGLFSILMVVEAVRRLFQG